MERLRILRESKGLRQSDVADLLNISRTAYNKYERGKNNPPFDALRVLADFYGVSLDYLLSHDVSSSNNTKISSSDVDEQVKNDEHFDREPSENEKKPAAVSSGLRQRIIEQIPNLSDQEILLVNACIEVLKSTRKP